MADALDRGEAAALVTIVSTSGSTPQRVGAKMLVYADGRTVGTIGGGCYEHDALGKAREAIRLRRPQLVHYTLNDDLAAETGLICGGQMDVYIEPLEPSPHLYLVGAGHVSHELAPHRAAGRLPRARGRRPREVRQRRPLPRRPRSSWTTFPRWLEPRRPSRRRPSSSSSRAATGTTSTRCARSSARELRYLGLIGSRAKVAPDLRRACGPKASPAERLARVHAPIGLDIGAVSPAEIAVSIVAELVAARSGRLAEPHVAAASLRNSPRERPQAGVPLTPCCPCRLAGRPRRIVYNTV